jgi:isoleucyl-tRNA synthetase
LNFRILCHSGESRNPVNNMENDQSKKNIFVGMEEEVLKFWQDNKIFEKSVNREAPRGEYVFYDGPPFITGLPHYATLLPSIAKDMVPRFWTMNGYRVRRVWGWDCHGLPAENKVEKELGLKNKKDIECLGVGNFVNACRQYVRTGSEQWEWYINRVGRWVDMADAYRTMDLNFMESVISAFSDLYKKDFIYEGYRTSLHCPRCATPLSKFEITMDAGSYKDVTEKSVVVKFKVKNQKNTYLLAWTTTPWTLPGNLALAVGSDVDYVKIKMNNADVGLVAFDPGIKDDVRHSNILTAKSVSASVGDNEDIYVILAKDRAIEILKDKEFEIDKKEFKGSELVGLEYEPLFDLHNEKISSNANAYKVYAGKFVTTADGTGIVHIAPNFGEDDFALGKENKLPLVDLMDENGAYTKEAGEEFAGVYYKKAGQAVLEKLGDRLFSSFDVTHSYPFCYRCGTPLIYRAQKAWYLNIEKIRQQLIGSNEKINWVPEYFKDGRFKYNLENAPDWCLSRSRYWGTPLPVWKCSCGEIKVIGSLNELYRESAGQLTKLILVRHGEARCNAAGIITALLEDNHLTEKGKEQVTAAIEKLKKEIAGQEKNIVAYASPVTRTRETAALIGKGLGLNFESADELREINLGSWENKDRKELAAHDELRQKYLVATPEEVMDFRCGGTGETQTEVGERIHKWLLKILEKNTGKIIFIVSHSDPIDDLISILKGRSKRESGLSLSGVNHIRKGEFKVVYINNATKKEIDLHKPDIDEITLTCEKCGGKMKRVPEVFDCWFESGSMPFAQFHYPFEKKEEWENLYPADFITEYTGQLRGWFYYLHVLMNCLFGSISFKNVVVTGVLFGTDGRKMSKSYGNYPDPRAVIEKYGADSLRYYFMASPIMLGDDMSLSERDIQDALRKNQMLLWNVYKFYEMYASVLPLSKDTPPFQGGARGGFGFEPKNILDQWIIARLNQLLKTITENIRKYNIPEATRPIPQFIDDFSTWYLRRSRDRFKGDDEADKQSALATTRLILTELSKAIAPVMPFFAEQLWQKMTGNNFANPGMSVHLEEWPNNSPLSRGVAEGRGVSKPTDSEEQNVLVEMEKVRKIVELGLAKRDEAGIKVRQPLGQLNIKNAKLKINYFDLIKDELNIKEIVCEEGEGDLSVELDLTMTPELIAEGLKRELVRFVNAERKNAGLTIGDRITLQISTASVAVKNAVKLFETDLKKDVLADKIIIGDAAGGKEVDVNGEKIVIKIDKI